MIAGAGAAAISTANFYLSLGVRRQHITMADEHGVIYAGRTLAMDEYKAAFALETDRRTLTEAFVGADMFLGLSVANIVTPEMVKSMAAQPIIFALANPTPEIGYDLAREARPDALIATGRSDLPNQVNNVLGFPFIFRGALDVRARTINEDMKIAASRALAQLAHEDVPDGVLTAYQLDALKFGAGYLIPKPLDPRVIRYVAPAVAKAAIDSGVARRDLDLDQYVAQLELRRGKGQQVRSQIVNKAKAGSRTRIVYGEGEERKIIRAASLVADEKIATPILLGRPEVIHQVAHELGLDHFMPQIIDPASSPALPGYIEAYQHLRERYGITRRHAEELATEPNVFGPLMVYAGDADAYVSGLTYDYPEVIRPALQIFHTRPGARLASGLYLMIADDRVFVFTDTTVNIEPDLAALAEIAILAADFAAQIDLLTANRAAQFQQLRQHAPPAQREDQARR